MHALDSSGPPLAAAADDLALLDLWQTLASAGSQAEAAAPLARLLVQLSGCDHAALFWASSDLPAYAWPGSLVPAGALRAMAGEAPQALAPPFGFSIAAGAGPAWAPAAALLLPLADGGAVAGRALLSWRQPPAIWPSEAHWQAIGRCAAAGLHQAERSARDRWNERYLALVSATFAALETARSVPEMLESALPRILEALGREAGAIYLDDAGASRWVLAASAGVPPAGWAEACQRWWPALPAAAGWLPFDFRSAAASLAAPWSTVPLTAAGRTLGFICLAAPLSAQQASSEAQALQALGLLFGIALERLQAHAALAYELEARNARWSALVEITASLSHDLDGDSLLDEIMRRSVQLLDARGGGIILREEGSDALVITAVHGAHLPAADMVGRRLKMGEGIGGRAILSRQPVIIDSYAAWPGSVPELTAKIRDAAVAAPLFSGGQALGALVVSDDTPGRCFTEDDAQTLSLFAQQAALILEGARCRQQAAVIALNTERARLAQDLHDGLAQDLAGLLLSADACQALALADQEVLRGRLETLSVGIQRAIREARATIYALRARDLHVCSLEDALRAQVTRFESQAGLQGYFSVAGAACQRLPQEHELALLRFAQEALTNVRKHAQADQVRVQLTWEDGGQVQLSISDNGQGCDPTVARRAGAGHLGLSLIQERIEALGGTFSFLSTSGRGATVRATLAAPQDAGEFKAWQKSAS